MRQLILDIRSDSPPSFDNFLPGANAEALATLRGMTGPAAAFSGEHVVFLWGEPGVGKTHLLRAWSSVLKIDFLARGPLPDAEVHMLAVDDVEALEAEDQIRLFALLNAVREQGGRVLVSGKSPPGSLSVRADLATRLAQGLVFRLHALSDADKAQALAIRAEALGMPIGDDIIRHMLLHCRRDLPHLLATVDALDALSLSRKKPVSLALLKELLLQAASA